MGSMGYNSSNILDMLYPAIAERLDEVFPEMKFHPKGGGWVSSLGLFGRTPTNKNREKSYSYPGRGYYTIAEQGGETLSYIDYWLLLNGYEKGAKGEAFKAAVRSLCNKVGIEYTESEEAVRTAQIERERQQSIEAINNKLRDELFNSDEALQVREYLKNVRGYGEEQNIEGSSVDVIFQMGLGCVTTTLLPELKEAMGELWNDSIDSMGIGSKYMLSIPFRSNGKIVGYNFRTVAHDLNPKYINSFKPGEKGKYLFGLTPLSVHKANYKNLTIVEGEIDSLHASILGLPNIVAMGGKTAPIKALKEAKTKGFDNVTILLDTEAQKTTIEAEDKAQKERVKQIKGLLDIIKSVGMCGYVAELPAEMQNGTRIKTDVDSFLLTHSISELKDVIDRASSGAKYLYFQTIAKYDAEDSLTDKEIKQLKEDVIDIILWADSPEDRNFIKATFSESLSLSNGGLLLTEWDIQERINELNKAEAEAMKSKQLKEAIEQAKNMPTDEALLLMRNTIKSLNEIGAKQRYSALLSHSTEERLANRMKHKQGEIGTNYTFKHPYTNEEERLTLPGGAITFVVAPTSHGKSTMLQNLALQVADNSEEGTTLYFTFEEEGDNVTLQMLNKYIGEPISQNNLRSITHYFRTGEDKYIQRDKVAIFKQKKALFMGHLYSSGKLRIYYEDYDSTELIEAIRYISTQTRVKAVFIDYIQLLSKNGNRKQRTEELKEICNDLKNLAIDTQIPIVVAAQANREVVSPLEMHSQKIAEAADLERIANKILFLWNSSFTAQKSKDSKTEIEAFESRTKLKLGTSGHIYAKLTKNRGGVVGLEAVLTHYGNTGIIEGNYKGYKEEGESSEMESFF